MGEWIKEGQRHGSPPPEVSGPAPNDGSTEDGRRDTCVSGKSIRRGKM